MSTKKKSAKKVVKKAVKAPTGMPTHINGCSVLSWIQSEIADLFHTTNKDGDVYLVNVKTGEIRKA